MCESILSLYKQNSWSTVHCKRTKTNLHWILQAIGSTMAIAGMVVEYLTRQSHFRSIHSQLGKIDNNKFKTIYKSIKFLYINYIHSILQDLRRPFSPYSVYWTERRPSGVPNCTNGSSQCTRKYSTTSPASLHLFWVSILAFFFHNLSHVKHIFLYLYHRLLFYICVSLFTNSICSFWEIPFYVVRIFFLLYLQMHICTS